LVNKNYRAKVTKAHFFIMNSTTALTHALVLALLAPDQARADKAVALAESIAADCTAKQIAAAKRNAAKLAK
jgi:hypothetical protein